MILQSRLEFSVGGAKMCSHTHNDKEKSGRIQPLHSERRSTYAEYGSVPRIRKGKRSEHEELARLVIFSAPSFLTGLFGTNAIQLLSHLAQQDNTLYSYHHALVAEARGTLAGAALGYDGKTMRREWLITGYHIARHLRMSFAAFVVRCFQLNRSFAPLHPADWYLSHLAVLPRFRGQGTGEVLLREVSHRAYKRGLERITLDVEMENRTAQKFYRKLGFHQEKESPPVKLGGHTFRFLRLFLDLKGKNVT